MAEMSQGAVVPLTAGKVIGGRFEVEEPDPASLVGDLYRAKDKKTNRRVFLHVLGPTLYATPQAHELLRQAVRVASALTHRNVVATFGMGTEPGGIRYVATEFVDGRRLTDLVAARRASGHGFSLKTAYNVVAHVLNALTYAHATTLHAAITPSTVFVNRSGRVKLAGFGILTALSAAERAKLVGERGETGFLAPELTQGGNADVRADVYGAAGLLYLLLTGEAPGGRLERPSSERADVSPAVDELLARALSADPAARPADAASLKTALQDLVRAVGDGSDAGIDVELDLETASMPPPAPAPQAVAAPPPPPPPPTAAVAPPPPQPAAPGAPKVGDRVSIHEAFRVEQKAPAPGRASKVDFDSLLQNVASQDAERWMVQKDKLDHGPFSPRTLIQQILLGQVTEDDNLLNMDTGERRKVKAWPEFKEYVARYKKQKAEEEKRLAIEASGRAETRGNFAKYFIAIAVFLVLAAGVTIFVITRQVGRSGPRTPDELADLFQPGRIEIQGTAGILPMRTGGGGGGGGRGGRGGGGGGGGRGGTYEDAMNQAVDMGNAEQGGGERQLTANDIARVLNGRLSMFRSCIVQEARTMPSTHSCSMDIAIAGSGSVLGVSVTTGSAGFKSCVSSKVRSVHFPSFPAPRMGARFGFSW